MLVPLVLLIVHTPTSHANTQWRRTADLVQQVYPTPIVKLHIKKAPYKPFMTLLLSYAFKTRLAMASLLLSLVAMVFSVAVANCLLTDYQKEEVLAAHNYYRGMVDPIATDMLRMVWI